MWLFVPAFLSKSFNPLESQDTCSGPKLIVNKNLYSVVYFMSLNPKTALRLRYTKNNHYREEFLPALFVIQNRWALRPKSTTAIQKKAILSVFSTFQTLQKFNMAWETVLTQRACRTWSKDQTCGVTSEMSDALSKWKVFPGEEKGELWRRAVTILSDSPLIVLKCFSQTGLRVPGLSFVKWKLLVFLVCKFRCHAVT